ncbi:hypothetical protein ACR75P_08460 [Faecalicoccus pleomorphus]
MDQEIQKELQALNEAKKEEYQKYFEQGCIKGFLAGLSVKKEG